MDIESLKQKIIETDRLIKEHEETKSELNKIKELNCKLEIELTQKHSLSDLGLSQEQAIRDLKDDNYRIRQNYTMVEKDKNREISQLKEALKEARNRIITLMQENDRIKDERNKPDERIQQENNELQRANDKLKEDKISQLEEALKEARNRIITLIQENDRIKKERNKPDVNIILEKENHIADLEKHIQQLETQSNDETISELKTLQDKCINQTIELLGKSAEIEKLKSTLFQHMQNTNHKRKRSSM